MIINVMRVVCRLQSTDSGGLRLRIGWDGLPLWRYEKLSQFSSSSPQQYS